MHVVIEGGKRRVSTMMHNTDWEAIDNVMEILNVELDIREEEQENLDKGLPLVFEDRGLWLDFKKGDGHYFYIFYDADEADMLQHCIDLDDNIQVAVNCWNIIDGFLSALKKVKE